MRIIVMIKTMTNRTTIVQAIAYSTLLLLSNLVHQVTATCLYVNETAVEDGCFCHESCATCGYVYDDIDFPFDFLDISSPQNCVTYAANYSFAGISNCNSYQDSSNPETCTGWCEFDGNPDICTFTRLVSEQCSLEEFFDRSREGRRSVF